MIFILEFSPGVEKENDWYYNRDMKKEKGDRILNSFVEVINSRLGRHLKNVILFGSRARGDYETDSDYDCLLIVDEVSPELVDTVDEVSGDFLYNHNIVFSAFPVSETNYEKQKFNPLFINARREGVIF